MKKPFKNIHLPVLVLLSPLLAAPAMANEDILRQYRCLACHSITTKQIGPAYVQVAEKYRGNPEAPKKLFDKVRKGGAGVWGDIPMSEHPVESISDDDLGKAINWILSLKQNYAS